METGDTEELKLKTMTKIKELIEYFGTNLYESGNRLVGSCPIHEGDNPSAFNINIDEDDRYYGNWFCNTKKCHEEYGGNIIGFTRAMLYKDGITDAGVIDFLNSFTEGVPSDRVRSIIPRKRKESKPIMSRTEVRKRLEIPAKYYLDKGYSESLLGEFDVGLCTDPNMPMYNRVVFPFYNDKDEMLGCGGRTINDRHPKWLYNKGFSAGSNLYNYYKALPRIRELGSIVLVEGQLDCLNLWRHGITNVCGLFGSNLTEGQEFLLQKSLAMTIITAFDNDEAGKKCTEKVKKNLGQLFNIVVLKYNTHDPGDLKDREIEGVKAQLESLI